MKVLERERTEMQRAEPTGRRVSGVALAGITAAISGVSVFVNSHALKAVGGSSSTYTTAKNLVAAAVLGVLLAAATRGGSRAGLTRPTSPVQWIGLAAVAVIGGSVPFLLFFEGLARVGPEHVGQAAFLQKSLVLYVAVLAVPLLKERIGVLHLAAIGLLLAGLATQQGGVGAVGWGVGQRLIVAATALWALEIVIAKPLLRTVSPLTLGAARLGGGGIVLIGFLAATGRLGELAGYSAHQWAWVLFAGLLLAGYVATWFTALARARAVDVTAILVPAAVVTAVLQALVDGVSLRPQALGLVLISIGAASIAALAARRRGTVLLR